MVQDKDSVCIPSFYGWAWRHMIWNFVQLESAVPPSFFCSHSILTGRAVWEAESPWLGVCTAQQQSKHCCAINIIFTPNSEHRTTPTAIITLCYLRPGHLPTPSLLSSLLSVGPEREKKTRPIYRASAAQQKLEHQFVITTLLATNLK